MITVLADTPTLSQKKGTSGIGWQTVLQLAKHDPRHLVFTGRKRDAADKLIAETGLDASRISFIACDMTSMASVKACVETLMAQHDRLDIFIENAGISEVSGAGVMTDDGYERVWQTNYLAHALMDHMLLPLLERTAQDGTDVRLVVVSSNMHTWVPATGVSYESLRDASVLAGMSGPSQRYAQSKIGNVLRADEIARRHPAITTVSLHPGVVEGTYMNSTIPWVMRKLFMPLFYSIITLEQGAYNQLWAATAPIAEVTSGKYYDPVAEVGQRGKGVTRENADKLWEWTEEELAKWA